MKQKDEGKRDEKEAAKKRFDDLRKSGYDGWIDQDGRKSKGPENWKPWPNN